MGKGLGIAAFVLLMISLPIPVVGNFITMLALLILAVSAWQGEKTWVIVTDLISWVKVFFLSPTLHMAMFGGSYAKSTQGWASGDAALEEFAAGNTRALEGIGSVTLWIVLALLIAPLAIMFLRRSKPQPAVSAPSSSLYD